MRGLQKKGIRNLWLIARSPTALQQAGSHLLRTQKKTGMALLDPKQNFVFRESGYSSAVLTLSHLNKVYLARLGRYGRPAN
jgi:hypothetical protein